MKTIEQMKAEFLADRKAHCEKNGVWHIIDIYGRTRRLKQPLNPNPPLMVITYNNGNGQMVIDMEQFHRLPKSKQKKILELRNK